MRRVDAQFRPHWRPGRIGWAVLGVLATCAAAAPLALAWEHRRIADFRTQLASLASDLQHGRSLPAPRAAPAYDASARQFLQERAAQWAPMLRTLENGSMIGVTPTALEFDAAGGLARVELRYTDSMALIGYLDRINEGVAMDDGSARWVVTETRAAVNTAPATNAPSASAAPAWVATIRSSWPR